MNLVICERKPGGQSQLHCPVHHFYLKKLKQHVVQMAWNICKLDWGLGFNSCGKTGQLINSSSAKVRIEPGSVCKFTKIMWSHRNYNVNSDTGVYTLTAFLWMVTLGFEGQWMILLIQLGWIWCLFQEHTNHWLQRFQLLEKHNKTDHRENVHC